MTEEEFNKQLLFTHWAGRATSLEDMTHHFLGLAKESFANHQDDKAKIYREVASILRTQSEKDRKKQREFGDL